jgi:hypothetical protein
MKERKAGFLDNITAHVDEEKRAKEARDEQRGQRLKGGGGGTKRRGSETGQKKGVVKKSTSAQVRKFVSSNKSQQQRSCSGWVMVVKPTY